MTPKEALDWVENVFEEHRVQLPDVELTLIREALTELEELKRDVKRYFELANVGDVTEEVLDEFIKIRDKLMEVGNEE